MNKRSKTVGAEVGESRFSFQTVTLVEEIAQSRFDVLRARREECARELGLEIVGKKGWDMYPEDGRVVTRFSVYVLKPEELTHLIAQAEAKAELRGRIDELEKLIRVDWSDDGIEANDIVCEELQSRIEKLRMEDTNEQND